MVLPFFSGVPVAHIRSFLLFDFLVIFIKAYLHGLRELQHSGIPLVLVRVLILDTVLFIFIRYLLWVTAASLRIQMMRVIPVILFTSGSASTLATTGRVQFLQNADTVRATLLRGKDMMLLSEVLVVQTRMRLRQVLW
jgi:hypothetical protein